MSQSHGGGGGGRWAEAGCAERGRNQSASCGKHGDLAPRITKKWLSKAYIVTILKLQDIRRSDFGFCLLSW